MSILSESCGIKIHRTFHKIKHCLKHLIKWIKYVILLYKMFITALAALL